MSEVKKSELKIAGGRLFTGIAKPREMRVVKDALPTVTWGWYDQAEGIVKWTFVNPTSKEVSLMLFRNGYFFGNAFFPIYIANAGFNVSWVTTAPVPVSNGSNDDLEKHGAWLAPLEIRAASASAPASAPAEAGTGTTTKKYLIAFVFTLPPDSTYSILEGGFSSEMPPSDIALLNVGPEFPQTFCIGYDPKQVEAWDLQTKTLMGGYLPNPMTVETVPFVPLNFEGTNSPWLIVSGDFTPSFAPLFNDPVAPGKCTDCRDLIEEAVGYFNRGQTKEGLETLAKAIDCYTKKKFPPIPVNLNFG